MLTIQQRYQKNVLSNGITVVTEVIPYLRSVSLGVWVNSGSKNESKENNGISHFLEHLAFKGTKKFSAKEIAMKMDSLGGHMDAFTCKEYTCYAVKILDEHLPSAVDLLADVLLNSLYEQSELEKEKQVILEEIKMVEDNPQDYLYDLFYQSIWGDHSLGFPIQGNSQNIKKITRKEVIEYLAKEYYPRNIVITAAGNLKPEELIPLLESNFACLKREGERKVFVPPRVKSGLFLKGKNLEQVHFCLGSQGLKSDAPERYSAYLLNLILGGSMSSRLFQKIREDRGLVYSIYSFNSAYLEAGIFGVYAGMSEEFLPLVLELTGKEFKSLKEKKVEEEELKRAREQLKGNLMLALESSSSRMTQLAKQEIYFGRYFSLEEIYSKIEEVTAQDILSLANRIFDPDFFNLTILGPCKDNNLSLEMLKC